MARLFKKTRNGKRGGPWLARYRAADGRLIERSTKCQDRDAARTKLTEWLKTEERIKAGLITEAELQQAKHGVVLLTELIAEHESYMQGLKRAASTVSMQRRVMTATAQACGWKRLQDLNRHDLEKHLGKMIESGLSARSRNAALIACVSFANWCLKSERLQVNPFSGMSRLNEKADRRHERRVLSIKELALLVDAAERRPYETKAAQGKMEDATKDKLLWLGKMRAMTYRLAFFTGLRYGELRSLTLSSVHLDQSPPFIELAAKDEKARRGAQIPIHSDLIPLLEGFHQRTPGAASGAFYAAWRGSVFPGRSG